MTTATEQNTINHGRAVKMYHTDMRARQIVDMCVAHALNESGEPTDYNYRRWAAEVTTEAVATLLRYIYDDDAEIGRLEVERDHYKRIAEETLRYALTKITIASITGADASGILAEGGDVKQAPGDSLSSPVTESETPK